MSLPGAYEVFVLLDHASELAARDELVDRWLLDLIAVAYLASDVACGEPEKRVELPGTVRDCVLKAADTAGLWESSELTTSGQLLAMLLVDLGDEMGR